jgi:hypothetical protein
MRNDNVQHLPVALWGDRPSILDLCRTEATRCHATTSVWSTVVLLCSERALSIRSCVLFRLLYLARSLLKHKFYITTHGRHWLTGTVTVLSHYAHGGATYAHR